MSENKSRSDSTTGYIMAAVVLIGNAFQPIINNARPSDLDTLLFTLMTVLFEFLIIIPFVLYELKTKKYGSEPVLKPTVYLGRIFKGSWKKLLIIGFIFAFATIFVIRGFTGTDSITGAVAVKTQPITMFLIGIVFLKEKVKWKDIIFASIMLLSVIFIVSKGTFQLGVIDPSVAWLILAPIMWNVGHSITKPLLSKRIITPNQLIFFRTGISLVILILVFLLFGNLVELWQILSPRHLFFMVLMGANYGFMHIFWYNCIKRVDLTIATSLIIPAPVLTAIFAVSFLGEEFYYFHLIGMVGTFIGMYGLMIVQKKKANNLKKS